MCFFHTGDPAPWVGLPLVSMSVQGWVVGKDGGRDTCSLHPWPPLGIRCSDSVRRWLLRTALWVRLEESPSSFLHNWILMVQPWSQQQKIAILEKGSLK